MTATTIRSPRTWPIGVLLLCSSFTAYADEAGAGDSSHAGLKAAGFFLALFLFIEFVSFMNAKKNQQWFEKFRQKYEPVKMRLKLQKRLNQQRGSGGAGLLAGVGFLWLSWIAFTSTPRAIGLGLLCAAGGAVLLVASVKVLRLAFTPVNLPE
ncbi:MAG: hypothetical protein HN849_19285 [Victivallales bacterium]|nr:hypothetical protein [Victivallales bacterium]MBT7161643.1 hypothetical protein [Victivallales bacterium]MBT7301675.1 hypothetical protein [Victivallales bacterium]